MVTWSDTDASTLNTVRGTNPYPDQCTSSGVLDAGNWQVQGTINISSLVSATAPVGDEASVITDATVTVNGQTVGTISGGTSADATIAVSGTFNVASASQPSVQASANGTITNSHSGETFPSRSGSATWRLSPNPPFSDMVIDSITGDISVTFIDSTNSKLSMAGVSSQITAWACQIDWNIGVGKSGNLDITEDGGSPYTVFNVVGPASGTYTKTGIGPSHDLLFTGSVSSGVSITLTITSTAGTRPDETATISDGDYTLQFKPT